MKLLLDQNLSPNLLNFLLPLFPGSIHVRGENLHKATDEAVWNYAMHHGFTIVSKDSDFHQLSFVHGHPPKVVWIRLGNCSTNEIKELLVDHQDDLISFSQNPAAAFLVLS